jgi:hypothetical protein
MSKAAIDKFLEKWFSRKLLAFSICTLIVLLGLDLPETYVEIVGYYILGQSAVDASKNVVDAIKAYRA